MSAILVEEIKKEIQQRLLTESIPRILQCLGELSQEQIWHRPNENSNSIGNLVLHLCGNVRQYLISSIGGSPDNRKRALEFESQDLSRETIEQHLQNLEKEIVSVFPLVTLEELERVRKVQGFEMSGLSVVVHVIEHFSYHTGQIAYYTKMLKDIDLKFYGGMDLDVTD